MTEPRKKKPTVGRRLKPDKETSYVHVSFKKEDWPVFNMIQMIAQKEGVAASELVVDSVRLRFGQTDLDVTKQSILQRYANRDLVGPDLFKTFNDVLEWELKNTEHAFLATKWGVSPQTLACIMYVYAVQLRETTRQYVTA